MRISDWSSDVCSSDLLITSIQIDEFDQFRQLELERNRHQAAVRLKIRRQIKRQASFELFRLCRTNGAVQPIAAIADPAETRSRCRNARNIRNRLARTTVHRSACKSAKLDVLIDSRVAVLREEFDRGGKVQRPRRTKDFRCRVENSKRVIPK